MGSLLLLLILASIVPAGGVLAQGLDSRSLVLSEADLPAGFVRDEAGSSAWTAADGSSWTVVTYRRSAASGPLLARSTVVLAPTADAAQAQYARLPDILAGQGFSPAGTAPLGADSAGFRSPDALDGVEVDYWTVAFRLDRAVGLTTIVEPRGSGSLADAVTLATSTQARVALALGVSVAPAVVAASSSAPVSAPDPAPPSDPAPVTGASIPPLPSQPTVLADLRLSGAPEIGAGLTLGGLSGLVALDRQASQFIAITDRGPNQDIKVRGDKGTAFLVPTFSPSIVKLTRERDQLVVAERIPLRLPRGRDSVTGRVEISGLPNGDRDEPAFSGDGKKSLGLDPNGVDTEGIAVDPRDGTYWICEEYGPSILHVGTDGTILTRLVPRGLELDKIGYDVKPVLPGDLLERKANRGFEGIAIRPDGQVVFAIMQSPLSIPNEDAGEASRNVRIVAVDISGEPRTAAVYLYQTEPYAAVGAREQDDVKIGDLAALSATRLLVTERDSGDSAAHRKVYEVSLEGATDVNGRVFGRRPLETMSDDDLERARILPVAKRLLVDLAGLGYGHELVEGLAVVDDVTIAVLNDNNFKTSELSELMLVQLPAPLR